MFSRKLGVFVHTSFLFTCPAFPSHYNVFIFDNVHNEAHMADSVERVYSDGGNFFGVACDTTNLVNEACRRHDVGPTAAAALGRVLTGATLLAALLKDDQSVLVRFEGNGPLKKVVAEAGYNGWVRGYVAEPHADLPLKDGSIDVAGGIGRAGFVTVIKEIGNNQKYPGTIQLTTSEVGDDLATYLLQSEQTPSTIGLSVHLSRDGRVLSAGGFLVQSLPPADENQLNLIEKEIDTLAPLSTLLGEGKRPADILSSLFHKVPHKKLGSKDLIYKCSCSREKMERAILSLGRGDLEELIARQGEANVRCEFCREQFHFDKTTLTHLLQQGENS